MVASRRGTRVLSPAKKPSDEAAETRVSIIRSTRRRTVTVTAQSQSEHTSDSEQDVAPAESKTLQKRETRWSKRLLSVKQQKSSQDADVSESESCCSLVSDIQLPSGSKRRSAVRAKAVNEPETARTDISSAETPRRSMRVQKKPILVLDSTTSQEDDQSEPESCSSVASLSTRITMSRRKPAVILEAVTHLEAESCSSVVSSPQGSTVRRSTRSRGKVTKPIPIHLEEREPAETTRARRGKDKSAEDGQTYYSDGCQSGPSLSPRRTTQTTSRVDDSDSESGSIACTSLDSPYNKLGKETPSSCQAGLASSNCADLVSRSRSVRVTVNMLNMSSPQDVCKDTTKEKPSSSEESDMNTRKSEPLKGRISLLDSSEDEESDDGLSVDGGNDEPGGLKSDDKMNCSEDQPGSSAAPPSCTANDLFVIDTRPGCQSSHTYYIDKAAEADDQDAKAVGDEEEFFDEEEDGEDVNVLFNSKKPSVNGFSTSIDPGLSVRALGGLYISFDGGKSKCGSDNLKRLKEQKCMDELLKKSVIVPGFEKKDCVPPYRESKRATKLKRREERAKTTGDGWFNMKAPELTEDLKNDLKALQMRSAMDPKHFYKRNDRKGFPKYFQVGTVVDNPIDFYHSRVPMKQRKRTMVEELLADSEFRSFNKRKYKEIMAEKAAAAAGKIKRKKSKFHKKQ